jgi:hypothetical protein
MPHDERTYSLREQATELDRRRRAATLERIQQQLIHDKAIVTRSI